MSDRIRFQLLVPRHTAGWLLRDEFLDWRAAGAVDGTLATDGVNTRDVLADTGNGIAVADGKFRFQNPPGNWTDALYWYNDSFERVAGRLMVAEFTSRSLGHFLIGWRDAKTGYPNKHSYYAYSTGNMNAFYASTSASVLSYGADTSYKLAWAIRATGAFGFIKGGAFTDWTMVWHDAVGSWDPMWFGIANSGALVDFDFIRMPKKLWLPAPLASDGFGTEPTVADSGSNSLDGTPNKVAFNGPEALADKFAWWPGQTGAHIQLPAAGLIASGFNMNECGLIAYGRLDERTRSSNAFLISVGVDANNRVGIYVTTGGVIGGRHNGDGTNKVDSSAVGHPIYENGTYGVRASKTADEVEIYFNGVGTGTPETGLDTAAGTLSDSLCKIGDYSTAAPWHGFVEDAIITLNGTVPTDQNMADLHTYLAAGTLTTTILDTMFGATNWAWWHLYLPDETAFPTIAEQGGVTALNGTAVNVSTYMRRAYFSGAGLIDIYSATLNTKFNGVTGGAIISMKPIAETWTDALSHDAFRIAVDGSNNILARRITSVPGRFDLQMWAGGTGGARSVTSQDFTRKTTCGLAWGSGECQPYLHGQSEGAALSIGTWSGSLSSNECCIGAKTTAAEWWLGGLSDFILVFGTKPTATNMEDAHNLIMSGQLTVAWLNTIFGTGNWAWWKCDEQQVTDGAGHAEGVAGGIGAGGAGKALVNKTLYTASGAAYIAPIKEDDIAVNGDFTNWTTDDPDDWTVTEVGAADISEVGTGEGNGGTGTGLCNIYRGDANIPNLTQTGLLTIGGWFEITFTLDTRNSGTLRVADAVGGGLADFNSTGAKVAIWRAKHGNLSFYAVATPTDITIDDVVVRELELSSLFNGVYDFGVSDVISTVKMTIETTTRAGLVLCLDDPDDPQSYLLAYRDGGNVVLDKCVDGTITNVISAAGLYGAGDEIRVIKDGTAVRLYYDNTVIGTVTVSDAEIISNTYHGLFSTYASNALDDWTVYARGSDGEFAILDKFTKSGPPDVDPYDFDAYDLFASWDYCGDQDFADSQVLDGVAEGVEKGQFTVNNPDGDAAHASGNALTFDNSNASWGDPGLWAAAVTRAAGKLAKFKIQLPATTTHIVAGFDTNETTIAQASLYFAAGGMLASYDAGQGPWIGAYEVDTAYEAVVVLRAQGQIAFIKGGAYTSWTLLRVTEVSSTSDMYPAITNHSAIPIIDYFRVPVETWLPTPLLSDGFSIQGQTDGLGHAEGIAGGLGAGGGSLVLTGTYTVLGGAAYIAPVLGAELFSNNEFDDWTADDPDDWSVSGESGSDPEISEVATGEAHADAPTPGGGMCNLYSSGVSVHIAQVAATVGKWTQWELVIDTATSGSIRVQCGATTLGTGLNAAQTYQGTFRANATDVRFRRGSGSGDDITMASVSLKELDLATLFAGLRDLSVADVYASVELTISEFTQAGIVICLDDADDPQNFIIAYHDGTNGIVDKCVDGTYTNVISAAATYGAGYKLEVHKLGTAVRLYYNGALVGSGTVSDAGVKDNTIHGLFSTYADNALDDLVIHATGSGDEHDALDDY